MRSLLGSETKNDQKSQFHPGIWDIHKSVLEKGPKFNVFQLIWQVNGPLLSNMVNNDPNHAKKG